MIKTQGDDRRPEGDSRGRRGLFTREIEEEMLEGEIDIRSIRMKDNAFTERPRVDGSDCYMQREDVRRLRVGSHGVAADCRGPVDGTTRAASAELLSKGPTFGGGVQGTCRPG